MGNDIKEVTDDSFAIEVLQAPIPVLVDFWADWCGPCKMIAPTLELIAEEFAGKIKIIKLNVDQNQITANNYSIRSIPTLVIFKGGKIVTNRTGALTKPQLEEFIKDNI